jgi:outer membrane protein assembly factor BamB
MLDAEGRTQGRTDTGPQLAGPAYDPNRAYVATDKGTLYAFNRALNAEAWHFNTDGGASLLTTPAVGAGRVYFEATDNNVYCVDAARGQLKWKFPRPDGSLGYSAPVFLEDSVYVCGETTAYRLNASDGKEVWKSYIGGKSLSTLETGGGRLYLGGDGVGLVALSPTNGSVLWSFTGKYPGDWFGTPLYAGGVVYVSTYNRMVYAVDATTGKAKWSYQVLGSALSRPAIDVKRQTLYVTSGTYRDNPTLTAINIRTGKKAWDYKLGHATGSPVVAGDRLYVGSNAGFLFAFGLK